MHRSLLFSFLLCLLACKSSEEPQADTWLLHDYGDGAPFYDAPFPSDHRRHADGTIDTGDFPNPNAIEFVTTLVGLTDGQLTGFGTTSTIYFRANGPLDPSSLPDLHGSTAADSSVFLVGIGAGPDHGVRIPLDVTFTRWAVPFGADNLLALLPLQGRPLQPDTRYAAVVLRDVLDEDGEGLGPAPLDQLPGSCDGAVSALADLGIDTAEIAGLAVFTTQDPLAEMHALSVGAEAYPLEPQQPFELTDVFDEYCVYRTIVSMPVFQEGDPPFMNDGGGLVFDDLGEPVLQAFEDARLDITVPRQPTPADGWPAVVFIRTGGGGDRPLIDRGVRDADGEVAIPGSGPALLFTRAGFVGVEVDGPHGGLRNVTGGDEQFLMFNILNPVAMRDNLRQSAAELTLLPDLLDGLTLDTSACDGASNETIVDTAYLALAGHSMGATIAPLVLASHRRYGAVVLSGAGGSWIYNIVYKQSPLDVRPLAEVMLQYDEGTLLPDDPALAMLQLGGGSADTPPFAWQVGSHSEVPIEVLMIQGIVDTYILPPIANSTSLSLGLDLAGPALDDGHPGIEQFRPLGDVIDLVGRGPVSLPAKGNVSAAHTAVVVQHLEDGIEDGHEVFFQTEAPKHQVRCFLQSWLDGTPVVVEGGAEDDPCP